MNKKTWRPWTNEEIETLRIMAAEGQSAKEIAYALKRSVDCVYPRLRNVPHPPLVPPIEVIRELAQRGLTAGQISDAIGRTRTAVIHRCKYHGIQITKGKSGNKS